MELLLALPGVITSCLLAWLLLKLLERQGEERAQHRIEVDSLTRSHAEQSQRENEAHRKEVADLCQRLQAPQQAVVTHASLQGPSDPPPLDLENDLEMIAARERALEEFAETLAAER